MKVLFSRYQNDFEHVYDLPSAPRVVSVGLERTERMMTQPTPPPGWGYWDGTQWFHQIPPQQPPVVINNMAGPPVFIRKRGGFWRLVGGLILFGVAMAHWQVFLVLAVLGAAYLGHKYHTEQQKQRMEIAARADQAYLNDPSEFLYPPTIFDHKNRHEKD